MRNRFRCQIKSFAIFYEQIVQKYAIFFSNLCSLLKVRNKLHFKMSCYIIDMALLFTANF